MVCVPEATDLGAWRRPGRLAGAQHYAVEEMSALGELAAQAAVEQASSGRCLLDPHLGATIGHRYIVPERAGLIIFGVLASAIWPLGSFISLLRLDQLVRLSHKRAHG